jgi:hypothetical protein
MTWKIIVEYTNEDCPFMIQPHGHVNVCQFLYDRDIKEDECRRDFCPIYITKQYQESRS